MLRLCYFSHLNPTFVKTADHSAVRRLIFIFQNESLLAPTALLQINRIVRFLQKQPAYVNWALKAAIACLFIAIIYNEVFRSRDFADIKANFMVQFSQREKLPWLIALLVLTPVNWGIETLKWLTLIRKVEYFSFWRAYKAVIAGVAFSLFTPNRVGEFGGRILFVRPRNALKAVTSTLVGSFAQQLVLIGFGFVGFIYFLSNFWKINAWALNGIILLSIGLVSILLIAFLNLNLIIPILKKITVLHRFKGVIRNVQIIRKYSVGELNRTLFWASIRYIIYSVQYYLSLRFFGIHLSFIHSAACIATVYLLQTSIPLPPLVGLMARGGVALKVWGLFKADATSILAATFTLWTANLLIPAALGMVFIINSNILKSLGYEKQRL